MVLTEYSPDLYELFNLSELVRMSKKRKRGEECSGLWKETHDELMSCLGKSKLPKELIMMVLEYHHFPLATIPPELSLRMEDVDPFRGVGVVAELKIEAGYFFRHQPCLLLCDYGDTILTIFPLLEHKCPDILHHGRYSWGYVWDLDLLKFQREKGHLPFVSHKREINPPTHYQTSLVPKNQLQPVKPQRFSADTLSSNAVAHLYSASWDNWNLKVWDDLIKHE